jgi:hypothetical protein
MAKNIPTSSVAIPSKIYPDWYFGFANMPSGNPAQDRSMQLQKTCEGESSPVRLI